MYACIFVVPLLTLIFVLRSRFFTRSVIHGVSCGLAMAVFLLSLSGMIEMIINQSSRSIQIIPWIQIGSFIADWLLKFDSLTLLMTSIFSWALVCIHLHLIWDQTHERWSKNLLLYFPVLTIAVFLFVSADNFLQLYLGWELIGIISCLLFISSRKNISWVTVITMITIDRLGNFGLLLVAVGAYLAYDTLIFDEIFYVISVAQNVKLELLGYSLDALTVLNALLILAAITKCAQLGFQRWFVEGSLINPSLVTFVHLVSMGLAGVFILIRFSPMIERTPNILISLSIIGLATSILLLVKALLCHDVGRTIIYLIFSQIGYILVACGSSAYIGGIFHFLNVVVIVALILFSSHVLKRCIYSDVNKGKQGGGKNWPPILYISVSLGFLSLAGFPFLSAYYSVLIILESSLLQNSSISTFVYYTSLLVAGITASLGFKFLLFIFGNANENKIEIGAEMNRVPWMFQLQLIVLTLLTLFFGTIGVNTFFGDTSSIFWGNVIPSPMRIEEGVGNIKKLMLFDVPLIVVFCCGIVLAYFSYVFKPELRVSLSEKYQTFLPRSYLKNSYGKNYMIPISLIVSYTHPRPYIEFYFVILNLWYGCSLHKNLKQIKIFLANTKHNFISYYAVAMLVGSLMFVLYHCYSLKS